MVTLGSSARKVNDDRDYVIIMSMTRITSFQ